MKQGKVEIMIGKRAFIPFITAGYPDLVTSEKIIMALAEAGAELVEVGIPFSDPVADGPVIQESSHYALSHGYVIDDYLEMVRRIREKSQVGLVFMTYLNPVLQYGFSKMDDNGADAGLDGILISDLIPREYKRLGRLRSEEEQSGDLPLFRKLKTVFLVAPNSDESRVADACRNSTGYIYLVSRTGVTGGKTNLADDLSARVRLIRKHTSLPVAVGFGISSSSGVEQVWQCAEGAIVGSAIVKFIRDNLGDPNLDRKVFSYVRDELLP
jgi:tryptophan synthase alpha chain